MLYTLGITMTGASNISTDLVSRNQITDYSFITQPFTLDQHNAILRCASGLGPFGDYSNAVLGGWYFGGLKVWLGSYCGGSTLEVRRAAGRYPGVINLYLCGTFSITEEGVYECRMVNSSSIVQTMRVGMYLIGRSELLDMYPITNHLSSLYTAAPMIDPPLLSTVTANIGVPFTLSCTSRGSPPDTFTWRKDSGPLVQSTSITTVTHDSTSAVFQADYIDTVNTIGASTYTCTVTNPIGSNSITITVIASKYHCVLYHQMHALNVHFACSYSKCMENEMTFLSTGKK